jgi:haloalkane dehalogenase
VGYASRDALLNSFPLNPHSRDAVAHKDAGYQVARVNRDKVFHYVAGRQVYELQDPSGIVYMMQSFSRVVEETLQLEDLQSLDKRLNLPPGWTFSTRILDANFALPTVEGVAEVVTDNLNIAYQR